MFTVVRWPYSLWCPPHRYGDARFEWPVCICIWQWFLYVNISELYTSKVWWYINSEECIREYEGSRLEARTWCHPKMSTIDALSWCYNNLTYYGSVEMVNNTYLSKLEWFHVSGLFEVLGGITFGKVISTVNHIGLQRWHWLTSKNCY
jgi:hypothetical protein